MNPYHKWLIRHRVYCSWGSCMKRGTRVIEFNGKAEVRCDNPEHRCGGPIQQGLQRRWYQQTEGQ